ncbi:MAG TPA: hypothetical protein VF147_08840, partial [Vicinamibacterales bacterium]
LGVAVAVAIWRGVPARGAEQPQRPAAVKLVAAGERLAATPGEKGATYYALAARTRRLTTRFADAVVVAEPRADGDVEVTVRDTVGRDLSHLVVNHLDSQREAVQFTTEAGGGFQALGEPGAKLTMEWANRQAYSLVADGVDANAPDVEWRHGLMRRRGAPERDLDRSIVSVETEWDEGLTATTSRRPAARRKVGGNREFTGELVVTRLKKDGQEAGTANWYPRERVFAWDLPGLTKGVITAKELVEYGGWPFTPDLEWMNTQAIAFHHFKTKINQDRFVARIGEPHPGLLARMANAVMPVLHANEPGCDNLHWLDGTVFRFCCDVHDQCYAKNGCSSRSWWQFWSSWRCTECNLWVVDCFELPDDIIFLMMQ